jgi:hypothetical protein
MQQALALKNTDQLRGGGAISKVGGQDSGGLGDFVPQKLTHFCETNVIFWQLHAEEIAVCSDNYTNNQP